MAACRFWMVRQTVIFRPFQSEVALAMSSPIFLGDCGDTSVLAQAGKQNKLHAYQTEGTDLGGQGRCGSDFSAHTTQVHCKWKYIVILWRHLRFLLQFIQELKLPEWTVDMGNLPNLTSVGSNLGGIVVSRLEQSL